MMSRLIACLMLAGTVAACGAGPAGPPTPPSDPTKTGYEPPGESPDSTPVVGNSIEQLCAYDCMRFEATCPASTGGSDCPESCAQTFNAIPGCRAESQAYLACLSTVSITCTNGSLDIQGCDGPVAALNNCSGVAGGSGMSSGGTAGASGGSAPPR